MAYRVCNSTPCIATFFSNRIESELVTSFSCVYAGEIHFSREEIDDVRYWTPGEISSRLGTGIFSSHFEMEIRNYLDVKS